MKENYYKLGDYKIIESGSGDLRWEAHFGIGELKEGRCFQKGSILFIGLAESQRDGFLKLEFLDHLKEYPDWLKTKYYCEDHEVFRRKSGKRVTREEMRLWMFEPDRVAETIALPMGTCFDSNDDTSSISTENAAFRLQRYEITSKTNGQIGWRDYSAGGIFRTGECTIIEDILFLGPWQGVQTDLTKRQFLANLSHLPEWNQTKYYCPRFSLHECRSVNLREKRKWWNIKRDSTPKQDKMHGSIRIPEIKSPEGKRRGISAARVSPNIDSPANHSKYDRSRVHFSRFKKANISKIIDFFQGFGNKRRKIYFFVFFILIICLLLFLIGYLDEHHETQYYRNVEHHSKHHGNHR